MRYKPSSLLAFALIHALSSVAVSAAPTDMTAPLPPALPWTGRSEALIARADDPWVTPAEQSGFEHTPSYAETRAWLARLDAASPLIAIENFGTSPEGRALYSVRVSKGGGKKPVLLVQAGIHAGEIDGKDAGMMLLRDIAFGGKDALIDAVDMVFVPIFSVDGHERTSPYSRPNQRGPQSQGWRHNAQNLNLNRDYLKADTPEMQAMLGLIERIEPALYLDIHVTDGVDYQYDVTYGFNGSNGRYAVSKAIGAWLDTRYRPAVDKALADHGHIPGPLIFALDDRKPDLGIIEFPGSPRFSQSYGDLRHMPSVLIENHSLKPHRQRVLGTYVLIEASLKLLADEQASLAKAIARDSAARPETLIVAWQPMKAPVSEMVWKGVAHESYVSAASGGEEIRWLGRPVDSRMKVYAQEPARILDVPVAYWVPGTRPDVIARLKAHGIATEAIETPQTVTLDMVRLGDVKLGEASEGHIPIASANYHHEQRSETFMPGSVRVPTDQPLGLVAVALLEPESAESLLSWGFFAEILQRVEYIEGYAIAPLADAMLAGDPALKAAFEAKLAADPAFASDQDARLGWFYERTRYFDARYLLYPVGREIR
ncbi:M14 family metallopeptidase [Sphingobium boeckii]|uniref:Peptidase M14 domain-containing protein n=1 Tax=Sphingobium boeckii TaxID=1082345 RepID=A0A7W9AKT1_9SPHN|nr:M14 family metallopeptidase [Sphingobium boeckii]MBB5687316.1 hypothetical protein [Sphingobium boeckii]